MTTPKRPVGRPNQIGGKKVTLFLDDDSLDIAKLIGAGNASKGIRRALELAQKAGVAEASAKMKTFKHFCE